jgi:hypothetical protein
MEKTMKWNDLITNPPTGNEYAIILFPCKTDCGILYTASNPHYAIKYGVTQGYTHWTEIELAPDHDKWNDWQNNLTPEEIIKSVENAISLLGNHDGIMDDDLLDILSTDDSKTTDTEKHDEIYDTSSKEYVEWMSNVWRLNDLRNKEIEKEKLDNRILPDGKTTYREYKIYTEKIGRTPLSYDVLWDVYLDSEES